MLEQKALSLGKECSPVKVNGFAVFYPRYLLVIQFFDSGVNSLVKRIKKVGKS